MENLIKIVNITNKGDIVEKISKHLVNNKTIVVQWIPEEKFGYGMAMSVKLSNHDRFIVGSRFDYGFFNIATKEGYTIISLPLED